MKSTFANLDRKVYCLMGLPFDAVTLAEATEQIRQAAFNRTPCFFSTPNLNFLIAAQSNKSFRESVIKSDLSLADGMPIVWMSKFLSIPITQRVAGSDVFEALRKSPGRRIKVYFFGGQEGVAERAAQVLNAENGGMECVGFESPGFGSIGEMSSAETIAKINASGAEFLVVSLGAVKGQAWIEHNLAALNVPVVSHLGAVVNFVAGSVRRAPQWMQRIGLEWVWRIAEEPALWKRYLSDCVSLLQFGIRLVFLSIVDFLFKKRMDNSLPSLEIRQVQDQNHLLITVVGAGVNKNLMSFKEYLRQYVNQKIDISIDINKVSDADSGFLGVLSLICGQQLNQGRSLKVDGQTDSRYSFDVTGESVDGKMR